MILSRKQYGIGFGLPTEDRPYLVLYTGTTFRQIIFRWNSRIKGFSCYSYHDALNDELTIVNHIDVCKLFIGITINK